MINNTRYSIKETSEAWGISLQNSSRHPSLQEILKHIVNISSRDMEVITPGPLNNSNMLTTGKITQPVANGHLILNPNGVDIRIIPGKIKSVNYENVSDNRCKVSFKNHEGHSVLSISFISNEKIPPSMKEIASNQIKLKTFDSNQNIEVLWRNLIDIHHFYPMLQQLEINKINAFRAVPDDLACQVDINSLMIVLNNLQKSKKKLMIFVGNDSVIQVYTGPVLKIVKIKQSGKIVIHGVTNEGNKSIIKILKDDNGQAWVVNKNSKEGFITSLELFDRYENHIAQLYGDRKEGQKQNKNWETLMKNLPRITRST